MTDVIATKDGDTWFFNPVNLKAIEALEGITTSTKDHNEAQSLVFKCSALGLTVESPAFTTYYQPPRLGKVSRNRPKGPRHPITRHRIQSEGETK